MNCAGTRIFLDAYLDGELEAGKMLEIDTHLEGCAGCQALLTLNQRLKSELRRLGEVKAPPQLRQAIVRMSAGRRWGGAYGKTTVVAASVLAAAAVLLMLQVGRTPATDNFRMDQVVDDVVSRHVHRLPMEVADADQAKAARWFEGKINFPVRPLGPGIKNATFEGARLSNVRDQQAAHMRYQVDGKEVTLMVFPVGNLQVSGGNTIQVNGRHVMVGRRNGYNVALLRSDDIVYALSSELPVKRLAKLLIAAQIP